MAISETMPGPGSVTILSGPVGAGKTTIARKLIRMMPSPLSYIEGDTFWSFIAKSDGMEISDKFRVIVRSMTAAAIPFARSGFGVVLDFSIPPGFLVAARKIVKELPLNYVMLLPAESVCATRAASRREGAIEDYSRFQYLYSLFNAEERYIIRNDELDAATVAAQINEGLNNGRFIVE
ncbi:MAG TPA: hypothetical protein VFC63_23875 [Blastocatellia bacterium]|nr:hypothetical protein [Blastocatellia bacterium]